jgi:sn-glycerol 3-phosphate transport system ATP-binding protein
MNFLAGKRSGDDVDVGGSVRVALPAELRSKAGADVTVGIRPEHLIIGGPGAEFRFTVETIEALGADSLVHGAFGNGVLIVRVEGGMTPALGTALACSVMPGKLQFFDTVSGKRLRA